MQAKLPVSLKEKTLSGMKVGASGYTLPWGMYADDSGYLWLNGNYTIKREPGGMCQMWVSRTQDGYIADVSNCQDFRWSAGGGKGFVGEFTPLPVCQLLGMPSLVWAVVD